MLWNFFSTDQTTKSWFLQDGEMGHDLFLPVITSTATFAPATAAAPVETATQTQKPAQTGAATAISTSGEAADGSTPAAIWPLALAGGVGVVFGLVWMGRRRLKG
jgi:outer membrane receptor protein involved in Fe transport